MSEPQDEPQIEEHELIDISTPVRDMAPLQFFGPQDKPTGNRDFRPVAISHSFKMDEQDYGEDGHGNFRTSEPVTPVHPSEKRATQPYLQEADTEDTEEPKQAPGITGSKQDQSDRE